jgi:ubiquinone biosynthesis protein
MRISSIPQIYRHINRWREILAVLSKYELAAWIGRLGPDFAKDLFKARGGDAIARQPWKTRLRLALAELGPTFIKLGQVLSTRPDLVGMDMAEELQRLQTNVPADPPEVVRATLTREFGRPVDELFAEFDEQSLASASIAQVHRARLKTGEPVVIKVQHADIQKKVEVDLEILVGVAQLAERIPEFRNFRPEATAAEFRRVVRRELDFTREQRNMQQFARDFATNPTVRIPRVFTSLCTGRVLTMDRIEGIKLSDVQHLREAGFNLAEIARRGAGLYMEMIFGHGFYHADPHPGNALMIDGNVIGLLDYGMVGRIDEQLMENITDMLMAISQQDSEQLTSIIMRAGAVPPDIDRAGLSLDVADFLAYYAHLPLDQFDVGGALREMTEIIWRYGIMLPARFALLLKVLITLEGTSRLLNPKFNLMEVMAPYRKRLLVERLSPRRQWKKIRRILGELERLIEVLPRGAVEILQQVQSGRFDVHLDHRGLEPSVNRLVLGMLASALFLGSSLMLSRDVPPLLRGVSIPGFLGCSLAIALGLRLWRAISKSGHLDRKR